MLIAGRMRHLTNNYVTFIFAVIEMQDKLKELLRTKEVDLNDVSYGFHWPPFVSVRHLHMHAIAPMSKMGFFARLVFKPINLWYCSVCILYFVYLEEKWSTEIHLRISISF